MNSPSLETRSMSLPVVERRSDSERRTRALSFTDADAMRAGVAANIERALATHAVTEESERDENECAICYESLNNDDQSATTLDCQHQFHDKCIGQWLARNQACPLCRGAVDVGPVVEDCIICADSMLDEAHNGTDQVWPLSACSHRFHRECVGAWLLHDGHCPVCRADVSVPERRAVNADMGRACVVENMNETRVAAIQKRRKSHKNRQCMKCIAPFGVCAMILFAVAYIGSLALAVSNH